VTQANQRFEAFVSRHSAKSKADIDWAGRRDSWLGDLASLHRSIRDYMQEYVARGAVAFAEQQILLTEDFIGSYNATRLTMTVGDQRYVLMPRGTLLIAAKGRVDVLGPLGEASLVLADKSATSLSSFIRVTIAEEKDEAPPPEPMPIEWGWKIVRRPPFDRFTDLTKQAFLDLLVDLGNGE